MKNNKGFSLVELLVSVAIVAALSIYFYKIIYILNVKYHEIEKEKNNIVNETYVTMLVYDALENGYTITLSNGAAACTNCITFTKDGVDKIIQVTGMEIDLVDPTTAMPASGQFTIPLKFNGVEYNVTVYY